MNTDQAKGKLKEVAGNVQEKVGQATGNKEQESKGAAHEAEGKVQKKVGDVKQGVDKIISKP